MKTIAIFSMIASGATTASVVVTGVASGDGFRIAEKSFVKEIIAETRVPEEQLPDIPEIKNNSAEIFIAGAEGASDYAEIPTEDLVPEVVEVAEATTDFRRDRADSLYGSCLFLCCL